VLKSGDSPGQALPADPVTEPVPVVEIGRNPHTEDADELSTARWPGSLEMTASSSAGDRLQDDRRRPHETRSLEPVLEVSE